MWVFLYFDYRLNILYLDSALKKYDIVRWFWSLLDIKNLISYFYQDSNAAVFSIWDIFDIFDTSPLSSYPTHTPKKVKLQNAVGVEELIQYYHSIFILWSFPPFLICDIFISPFYFLLFWRRHFSFWRHCLKNRISQHD